MRQRTDIRMHNEPLKRAAPTSSGPIEYSHWSTRASHAEKDAIRKVHPDTGSGSEPTAAAPAGSAPVSVALCAPVVIARWRREASPATQAARQQASVKQLERVPERRRAADRPER